MLVKLLIAAVVLLVVLLLALVWAVSILAKISLVYPALVTAVFFTAVVLVLLYRRWAAHRAASGLEQGLRDQAKAQAQHMRPDLEADMHEVEASFERAIGALKTSPNGRRGDALYFLPWYAIIGPSGAGKTTALRHSGLKFPPIKGARDAKVRGLGGTRNCDWWLTNQAVLLDTAGRWATQEEDHDEWLGFLSLLKKFRPKRPLNGVIAAISIGDLVNANDDEVHSLARRMRERVDEIIGQLGVSLPVYLILTKCDLIEGFIETFSTMSVAEREQVWGFTAPLTGDLDAPGDYFEHQFDDLTHTLEGVSLSRIGGERGTPARQAIYAFPQQVMATRRNLSLFVTSMFEGNVYQETPSLRGVYLTSGTQEGRPFSLLLSRLAEAVGISDRVAAEEPVLDQKSYFLRDVFMKIIFEDRDLASVSQKELQRQRIQRIALTTALALVALCVGVVPSFAFVRNRAQLVDTATLVDKAEGPGAKMRTEIQRLDGVRKMLSDLAQYEVHAPSFITTLGMYQGDRVLPVLRKYSAALMRRELVQPRIARDVQAMTEFGFRYESAAPSAMPTAVDHSAFYDRLKLHLLLSAPRARDEPPMAPQFAPWVAEQLSRGWGEALQLGPAEAASLDGLAQRYVQYASEMPELAFTRDQGAVRRTRAALTRLPLSRHSLERIIAKVAREDYDLTLPKLIGNVSGISAKTSVRGAFTRRGWENVVRDALSADGLQHAGELWVLGLADRRDQSRQVEAQLEELTTLYLQSYAQEWRTFLGGVRTDRPNNHAQALSLINELLQGQPTPISMLMHKVHYNVQLKPKPTAEALTASAGDALKDKVKGFLGLHQDGPAAGAVNRARALLPDSDAERMSPGRLSAMFSGFTGFAVPVEKTEDGPPAPVPPYSAYEEQLSGVRDALQGQGDEPQGEQLLSRLSTAQVRVRTMINGREPAWRPVFEALLLPPFESAQASSNRNYAESLARRWCTEVAQPFERDLREHYPFARRGLDLSLETFANFYKPGSGALWRFTKEALSSTVQLEGEDYEFASNGRNPAAVYSNVLPDFLTRSRELSAAFFPPGAEQPKVDFEIRIHPAPGVATTTFTVGGKTIEYHNGPERWTALSWPGTDPEAGAGFMARGANGMQERAMQQGHWGLFRLLEAGTVTRPSNQTFTVAWQLRTHDVTLKIDIRPLRADSPFFGEPQRGGDAQLLSPLRGKGVFAPRQITHFSYSCTI